MKILSYLSITLLLTSMAFTSCRQKASDRISAGSRSDAPASGNTSQEDSIFIRNLEARDDSLAMIRALEMQSSFNHKFVASVETTPVRSAMGADAADDPAIWVNTKDPDKSLVLGTNKTWGIYVYDLMGKEIQSRNIGRVNNIDLREGFPYKGREQVLVAGSNRTNNSVSLMIMDPDSRELSDTLCNLPSTVDEVYGLCNYRGRDGHYVFVNGIGGMVEQWKIKGGEAISGKLVRTFSVNSQPEGMAADDRRHILYIGVEQEGIYMLSAEADAESEMNLLPGSTDANINIFFDIEGLALFSFEGQDYLVASSQGNFSYALFRTGKNPGYVDSFVITDGMIDGVEETDGLDIALAPFSDRFPEGMLVVQDGFNKDGEVNFNQNFKYLSFEPVKRLLRNQ